MNHWQAQLKILQRHHGLKRAVLADLLGVDPATISRWAAGRQEPDLARRRRLKDLSWKFGTRIEADIADLMASPLAGRTLLNRDGLNLAISVGTHLQTKIDPDTLVGRYARDIRADEEFDKLHDANAAAIRKGEFIHMRCRFRSRIFGWTETYTIPIVIAGQVHLLADRCPITAPEVQTRLLEVAHLS